MGLIVDELLSHVRYEMQVAGLNAGWIVADGEYRSLKCSTEKSSAGTSVCCTTGVPPRVVSRFLGGILRWRCEQLFARLDW